MSRPTSRQIHDLTHAINKINLTDIETRLTAAMERLAAGSTRRRDGYPTGGLSNGGDVTLTSVEGAADANVYGKNHDTVQDDAEHAYWNLVEAANHLGACIARLDHIDQIEPVRHERPPEACLACDRLVMRTSADPLTRGLCSTCYEDYRRQGMPDITEYRARRQALEHHDRQRAG